MKNLILRVSTAAFAAGLAFAAGCGSSSGCGGTNLNENTSAGTITMKCGPGTYLNSANQCVAQSGTNNANGTNTQNVRHVSN